MARYRENIPLYGIDVQYVSDEIAKYMQYSGFAFADYKGQGLWVKPVRDKYRPVPGAPPIRVHIAFYLSQDHIVLEAFVLWKMLLTLDSPEYGLDAGIMGIVPKSVLKDHINQVRGFIFNLLQNATYNMGGK